MQRIIAGGPPCYSETLGTRSGKNFAEQSFRAMDGDCKSEIPLREGGYPEAYFAEELKGWHGYVQGEMYLDEERRAAPYNHLQDMR